MPGTLGGMMVPLVSPFDATTGELAAERYARHVRYYVDLGVSGVVVAGSSGESALLDEGERAQLVAWAREMVPDDRWVVAGVGGESTRITVRRAHDAARAGADAVLVVAPHYYGPAMTPAALAQHYRRVADDSPVPVILYNIPKYMHFSLAPTLVSELAKHENIVGIKDSSGNREVIAGYLASASPTFSVLTGNAGIFHDSLKGGASGGILAVALFAAGLSLEIYDAVQRGEDRVAAAAQERLAPLGTKIVGEFGVAGVKAAMDNVALAGGTVRPPLLPLDALQVALVVDLLRSAELATAA